MHVWICLHLWRSEAFGIKLEAQWNPPCVRLCANIWFSSCWLFIAKLKVSVTAEDGGWTEIWYLCTQAQSPVSLSHTHTNRAREKSQASSLHMHILHQPAKMPANKPLFTDMKQHECFFQTSGTSFFIHQRRTTWIFHWQEGTVSFFCFTEGLRKAVIIFLWVQRCRKTQRERGERGARTLLGTLNNSVNQALRKAEQVKIFVCFPQWQFQRDVNTRPLTLKGYNTTHCFFYTYSIAVGEMLYGSTICFALWWILVWNEMHAGRSHDM